MVKSKYCSGKTRCVPGTWITKAERHEKCVHHRDRGLRAAHCVEAGGARGETDRVRVHEAVADGRSWTTNAHGVHNAAHSSGRAATSATDPELHNVVRAARCALAVGATVGALAARYPAAPSPSGRNGARAASSAIAAGRRSGGAYAAASVAVGATRLAHAVTLAAGPVTPWRAMGVMSSVIEGSKRS